MNMLHDEANQPESGETPTQQTRSRAARTYRAQAQRNIHMSDRVVRKGEVLYLTGEQLKTLGALVKRLYDENT